MKTVKFHANRRPVVCSVNVTEYARGGMAVELIEDGESYCTLSVWFPESVLLPAGVFYLKDWSENTDIAHQLREQGVLKPYDGAPPIQSGFVCSHPVTLNL